MMPKIDGFEVCKQIKNNSKTQNIPILFITSNTKEEAIYNAFEYGGVDYIRKPLNNIELQQRVKLHLNLSQEALEKTTSIFTINDEYYWDKETKQLYKNNNIIKLSKSEQSLLELLINKQNIAIDPIDMCNYIYDDYDKEYNNKSIRNLVLSLKNKLPKDIIINIYGKGYMLKLDKKI